jgi:hypothetical protein
VGFRQLVQHLQEVSVRVIGGGDLFTLTLPPHAAVQVEGVYTEPYRSVDVRTQVEIASESPLLGIRDADLPRVARQDDTVQGLGRFAGRTWRVSHVQSDGEGISTLVLIETT